MFWQDRRWKRKRKKIKISPETVLRIRLLTLHLVVLAAFGLLAVQLWKLQIVEGAFYRQQAEYNRLRVLPTSPQRGVVYDRNGTLLLRNIPSFTVSVVPTDLPKGQQAAVATRLARLLNMRTDQVERLIDERRNQQYLFTPMPIKTNVAQMTAFTVEENHLKLPGVIVEVEPIRQYLDGPITSHLLGYVWRISAEEYEQLKTKGYEPNDKLGKTGVEQTFEDELRGKPGWEQVVVDVNGRKIDTLQSSPATAGHNLILTIDLALQQKMYEVIQKREGEAKDAKYAAAVMMNVRTGEILGMVSVPSYDANLFSSVVRSEDLDALYQDPGKPFLNHAATTTHPPGSIFKLITASGGLQEHVVTPKTVINAPGALWVGNSRFNDWAAFGPINFYQAIAYSSDVYFYTVGGGNGPIGGLGPERLAAYSREFGLGVKTGIELPSESAGLVPDPDWKLKERKEPWYLGNTYNMSIGQGDVLVTPLQMVRVVATVANGGKLLRPRLIRAIVDKDGRAVRQFGPELVRQVKVDPANLAEVRKGTYEAVQASYGTATLGRVPGIEVGGKTGTAEFGAVDPKTGHMHTHAWYLTFAPYQDPEVALVVFQQEGVGALSAAPLASEILKFYFEKRRAAIKD